MKYILSFTIALAFITFAAAPAITQSSDDNDGDGISNSEDACPGTKGTRANKGCPEEAKTPAVTASPKPTAFPTPKPVATPAYTAKKVTAVPTSPQLADCKNIIEDAGCRKFYGRSGEQLRSMFGQLPVNGSYAKLGIWFYMWAPTSSGTPTVAEVTFYGTDFSDLTHYYGNPGEKIDWTATAPDVIRAYGKPTKESPWTTSTTNGLTLHYGSHLSLEFENEKLLKVTIRWPQHDDDTAAYFEKMKKEYAEEKAAKEKAAAQTTIRQNAERESSQMMTDYDTLLDQLRAKVREGERIVNSERMAIAAGGMFKAAVQKKIDRVVASGDALIKQFGDKYKGKVTAQMAKGIMDLWRPAQ